MDAVVARAKSWLDGERVMLRGLTDANLEHLAAWNQKRSIGLLHSGTTRALSQAAHRDSFAQWGSGANGSAGFAIVAKQSAALVGACYVHPRGLGSGTFHIFLGPTFLGQGYGPDATRLAVRYAHADMNLHRLELMTSAYNTRAIRAYKKAGFVLEGTLRHVANVAGQWVDDVVMSHVAGLDVQDGAS